MLRHTPVLLQEILDLVPHGAKTYMDGTLGHAGHTQELLKAFPGLHVVGVDKDLHMIEKAEHFLSESSEERGRFSVFHGSYDRLPEIIDQTGVSGFDCILLDLGVNMDHFKVAERGFSIKLDGDLDMRFDTTSGVPLKEWLRTTHFEQLTTLFETYTDFGQSFREKIARGLLEHQRKTPFVTTKQINEWAISQGISAKVLAVMFQAFRIVINDELGAVERFLASFSDYLLPGGRCCVITYHSGEDRLVKVSFKELVDNGVGILYNKKVIKPTWKEIERNKASRSAKLRVFEKN